MTDLAPRLRPLEAFPVQHEGREMIALRDPAGYTDAIMLLPRVLLEIVSLFDGEHSIADIKPCSSSAAGSPFAAPRAAIDPAFRAPPARPAAPAAAAAPRHPAARRAPPDRLLR